MVLVDDTDTFVVNFLFFSLFFFFCFWSVLCFVAILWRTRMRTNDHDDFRQVVFVFVLGYRQEDTRRKKNNLMIWSPFFPLFFLSPHCRLYGYMLITRWGGWIGVVVQIQLPYGRIQRHLQGALIRQPSREIRIRNRIPLIRCLVNPDWFDRIEDRHQGERPNRRRDRGYRCYGVGTYL